MLLKVFVSIHFSSSLDSFYLLYECVTIIIVHILIKVFQLLIESKECQIFIEFSFEIL